MTAAVSLQMARQQTCVRSQLSQSLLSLHSDHRGRHSHTRTIQPIAARKAKTHQQTIKQSTTNTTLQPLNPLQHSKPNRSAARCKRHTHCDCCHSHTSQPVMSIAPLPSPLNPPPLSLSPALAMPQPASGSVLGSLSLIGRGSSWHQETRDQTNWNTMRATLQVNDKQHTQRTAEQRTEQSNSHELRIRVQ